MSQAPVLGTFVGYEVLACVLGTNQPSRHAAPREVH